MFGTQKEEEIDNYTDYSDADPFLSLPICKFRAVSHICTEI